MKTLLFFLIWTTGFHQAFPVNKATYTKKGKVLEIEFEVPKHVGKVELQLFSARNRTISRITDDSPYNPNPAGRTNPGKEMYFPVMDIRHLPGLEFVLVFENVGPGDQYSFNGDFNPGLKLLTDTVALRNDIEHWENTVYVRSAAARLVTCYYRRFFHIEDKHGDKVKWRIPLLSEQWSGSLRLVGHTGRTTLLIDESEIDFTGENPANHKPLGLNEEDVIQNLDHVVSYILRAQNLNPMSPTYGGLYLFYDLHGKMYRCPDWIWSYGPSIRVLLEAAHVQELSEKYGYERLMEAARLIGEATLRFQVTDPSHPAYGLLFCRFDPGLNYPEGFEGFYSPADSHFLMGYGWIPLYKATGDKRFLKAAEWLAHQTWRILKLDDVIEQDYLLKAQKWKSWTLDESGFGMIGFKELYQVTQNDEVKRIGKAYIESLMPHFQREDGLWQRVYLRNSPERESYGWTSNAPEGSAEVRPTNYMLRGQGWAMIGLLASSDLLEEATYLTYAQKMADFIVNHQLEDGNWKFKLDKPAEEMGYTSKGTALWSMLLYQLYRKTSEEKYLQAARKSLRWCNAKQYNGDDMLARGGLVDRNGASGIVYRYWFDMITTYGVAFYGLALLEELSLKRDSTKP